MKEEKISDKEKEVENPVATAAEEVVPNKAEDSPAPAEESTDANLVATETSSEVTPPAGESPEANYSDIVENISEAAPPATEATSESSEATKATSESSEEENAGDQDAIEETPEIKVTMPRSLSHNFFLLLPNSIICTVFHLYVSFLFTSNCGYPA